MSLSINDLIKGQLGAAVTTQFASQYNELEAGVKKAINALVPIVLSTFSKHSTNAELLQCIVHSDAHFLLENGSVSEQKREEIERIITLVFGKEIGDVTNVVATFSGVNNSSAHRLLQMITSVAIGIIGKKAKDENLSQRELQQCILELNQTVETLPNNFPLDSFGAKEIQRKTSESLLKETADSPTENKIIALLKWIIPLLLLGYSGYVAYDTAREVKQLELKEEQQDTISLKKRFDLVDIPLKDTLIKGKKEGFEQQVIDFLEKKDSLSSKKEQTFVMDRLKFERLGEKVLTASSLEQIKNLATILKKYPETTIEIHAYNNDIPNWLKNTELSEKRADHIHEELENAGIKEQIISSIGFGNSKTTIHKGATSEEKTKDRIIEIKVQKP